jgi:hypothetical protein
MKELTMKARPLTLAITIAALGLVPATASPAASDGAKVCTWGGTPTAPTGLITFSPGVMNTPSTGPIQFTATGELAGGSGCTGKLTFTGYIDPGTTCAVNAPFHAKAVGLPPVKRAEAQVGAAGSQPVLLYDAHGNVVGSEQAQFLTAAATDPNDPGYLACGTAEGLTTANWSDTVELFAP